ncbi:MAG: hypothetical protein GTO14_07895 [Anaerolineales bacterium]|nr:hypothetical protein [Anaerolineales bacterium]
MKIRDLLRKSERGQAFIEYTVLFPPVLLLSIMILIPMTERANYIFCRMVNTLDPSVCDAWLEEPGDEQASPSEDLCVTLVEEEGAAQCDQHADCTLLPGLNYGSFDASADIQGFVIKAGTDYFIYESGLTEDGCYSVYIDGNHVTWELVGHEAVCQDVSHNQVWKVALCQ